MEGEFPDYGSLPGDPEKRAAGKARFRAALLAFVEQHRDLLLGLARRASDKGRLDAAQARALASEQNRTVLAALAKR